MRSAALHEVSEARLPSQLAAQNAPVRPIAAKCPEKQRTMRQNVRHAFVYNLHIMFFQFEYSNL
jgi:hypothetical protein